MSEASNFFESMSVFELVEISYMQREAMFMDMSIFLTILSGFLVLVYLVGKKLDRIEASAVTLLYSVYSLYLVIDFSMIAYRHMLTNAHMSGNEPNVLAYIITPALMLLGLVLSIWYMYRKRGAT